MNIQTKLRLIQEGYSMEDINSGDISPLHMIKESFSLPDFLAINSNYIVESSTELLHESSNGIMERVEKIFKWIKDKIMQFINFIRNKFNTNNNLTKKIEDKVNNTKAIPGKQVNYEMTVYSKAFDNDNEDFLKNGLEKVYNVFNKRIEKITGTGAPDSDNKVVQFGDAIIDNEQKFLDSVFNEVFGTPYSEHAIMDNLYGSKKQVIVWPEELKNLIPKLRNLNSQQQKIVDFSEKYIPEQLKTYERVITIGIKLATERLEEAKEKGNYKVVNAESKVIHTYMSRMEQLVKVYNYLFKVSAQFLNAHSTVTFKFGDSIDQVIKDINGEIKLQAK